MSSKFGMFLLTSMLLSALLLVSYGAVPDSSAQATSCEANNQASLVLCIGQYNSQVAGTELSILVTSDIELTSELPAIDNSAIPSARLIIKGRVTRSTVISR